MGSQQLLLIVLGVIVVGVAIVVGIAIFGGGANSANKDAITQDMIQMAAAAQGYYHKPKLLGGGGRSFSGITLNSIGLGDGATTYSNDNADYFMVPVGTDYVYLIGRSKVVDFAYIVLRVMVGDIKFYIIGWGKSDTDPTAKTVN